MMFLCASLVISFFLFQNGDCSEYELPYPWESEEYMDEAQRVEYVTKRRSEEDSNTFREIFRDTSVTYRESDIFEFLRRAVNMEYESLVSDLAQRDGLYVELKLAALAKALESVFLKTVGVIDRSYIEAIIGMIRRKVALKQKLIEFGLNGM